jgi:hypothetical protein
MKTPFGLLFLLLFVRLTFAIAPDTTDAVLILYQLSAAQEAQFNDTDGVMSPFWDAWNENAPGHFVRDYISMRGDDARYSWNHDPNRAFTGPNDVWLIAKGAYGANGVYFWVEVTDNVIVPPTFWGSDEISIYTDPLNTTNGLSDPMNWYNPTQWALTFSSRQLLRGIGDSTRCVNVNYDKGLSMCGGGCPGEYGYCDYSSGGAYFGLTAETISKSATQKITEMFVPYKLWKIDTVFPGNQCGFIIGYNDVDSVNYNPSSVPVKMLQWQGLCDPYCQPPNGDVWGDVEFGQALTPAHVINRRVSRPTILDNKETSTSCFDIRGKLLKGHQVQRYSGVLIGRGMDKRTGTKHLSLSSEMVSQ